MELGEPTRQKVMQPSATLRKPMPDGFALWHLQSVPVTCCDNALMHLEPPKLPGERKGQAALILQKNPSPALRIFKSSPKEGTFDAESSFSAGVAKPTRPFLGRPAHLAGHIPAAQGEPGGSWDHGMSHICSSK